MNTNTVQQIQDDSTKLRWIIINTLNLATLNRFCYAFDYLRPHPGQYNHRAIANYLKQILVYFPELHKPKPEYELYASSRCQLLRDAFCMHNNIPEAVYYNRLHTLQNHLETLNYKDDIELCKTVANMRRAILLLEELYIRITRQSYRSSTVFKRVLLV